MRKRGPNISDVAKDAGLSIKTVSRVLNNERYVTEGTRVAVLAAVERLHYRPSAHARSMRAENSHLYGLLYQNPMGGFHAEILHGALSRCQEKGLHLVVELVRGRQMADQLEDFVAQVRLDGAILTPPHCDNKRLLAILREYGVPAVRISPGSDLPNDLSISIDDEQAAFDLTSHLMARGHSRIGFIEGIPGHRATGQRRAGFEAAFAAHGIRFDEQLVRPGLFTLESGIEAGLDLLGSDLRPTAVVASNDESAAGVIAAAARLGLKAPQDVSICGFDDSPVARHLTPALTTIRQPTFDFGQEAIAMLMSFREAQSRGQAPASVRQVMRHELVERSSVHSLAATSAAPLA